MYLERVYDRRLAQAGYLVGCQATGEALAIDPGRNPAPYLEIAAREGLTIAAVTETHVHADYLSGSRELAARAGARLLLSAEGGERWRYRFEHHPLHDGATIPVGNLRLEVLHTPGHTPEHISFLLVDPPAGNEPRMIFTGDSLFVGDVGRPDLLEAAAGISGTSEEGARAMFGTLRRLAGLPDHVVVWPGHGAGSACGKALGAVPVSTIGFERRTNWAFGVDDVDRFVPRLLAGQPDPPRYFGEMKRQNLDRPPSSLRVGRADVAPVEGSTFAGMVADGGTQIVDIRPVAAFAGGHARGSLNIGYDDGMVSWFGWLLSYDQPIVIVGPRPLWNDTADALASIGLDSVVGGVEPDAIPETVIVRGVSLTAPERVTGRAPLPVIDVRNADEYAAGTIPGAVSLPLPHLPGRLAELPTGGDLTVFCRSGYRSAIAASYIESRTGRPVASIDGGYVAWAAQARTPDAGR